MKSLITTAMLAAAVTTCMSAAQFRVNVPVEAQWGRAILPAGDYLITTSSNSPEMRVSGNGRTVSVLVASSEENRTHASELRINNINGRAVIQQLRSAPTGKTYVFLTPPVNAARSGALGSSVAFTLRDQKKK
jgi:hypothetical protein